MRRFKFKLEVVLKERKRIEDMRLREWTLSKRILQDLVDELTALETRLEEVFGEATETVHLDGVSNDIGVIQMMDSFIVGTKLRIERKKSEILRAARLTEKKRLEFVAASQKREALEKFKEKKFEDYKRETLKREHRDLDDVYIMSGAAHKSLERADEEEEASKL